MKAIGRQERKLYIDPADYCGMRARLRVIARPDTNAGTNGNYKIRSLYFDNYEDKAVIEKLAGVSKREKFRIRYYNDNPGFIRLEKKSKINRLCFKESAPITAAQCEEILAGQYGFLRDSGIPLLQELYVKMNSQLLRPKTIVDYRREAFIYAPGNVRITFDSKIRTSCHVQGLLNPNLVTLPCAAAIVLEVKYDGFLPEIIRDTIQLGARQETEFSKYVVARMAQ